MKFSLFCTPAVLRLGPVIRGAQELLQNAQGQALFENNYSEFLGSAQDIGDSQRFPRRFSSEAKVEDCSKPLPKSSRGF